MEKQLTALKINFKGEIHRIRVNLSEYSFEALCNLFETTYALHQGQYRIQYKDNEGDVLNVTSGSEYNEAVNVFMNENDKEVKALRFNAITKHQAIFEEKVTDPLVKAIEQLIASLNIAMEKVKNDEFARKCAASVSNTLNRVKEDERVIKAGEQMKKGAAVSGECMNKAINEVSEKIKELELEKVFNEASENIKIAAHGVSSFTIEVVEDIKKQYNETTTSKEVAPTPVPVAAPASQTSTPAPVEVQVQVDVEAEAEWEEVVQPSEEELKWSEQLTMVCEIFPACDKKQVIDLLEKSNGNIEYVLNVVAEQ